MHAGTHARTHTHTFNGPFSGTTQVSRYQKGKTKKPIWILLKQETASGSGISWAVCKSAPRSRHITMPAPHHSVFYRPDALSATQPTASKHWRQVLNTVLNTKKLSMRGTTLRNGLDMTKTNWHTGWLKIKYPTGEYAISLQPVVWF